MGAHLLPLEFVRFEVAEAVADLDDERGDAELAEQHERWRREEVHGHLTGPTAA